MNDVFDSDDEVFLPAEDELEVYIPVNTEGECLISVIIEGDSFSKIDKVEVVLGSSAQRESEEVVEFEHKIQTKCACERVNA